MALADVIPLPVIMYNVPSRTASNMTADTVIRLAENHQNIGGIKDASADLVQATKIIRSIRTDFLVLSGDDPTTLPFIGCGGHGVISVIANAYPEEFSTMTRLALQGDFDHARNLHQKLIDLHHWLYVECNPVGIKGCLYLKDLCQTDVRLPLVSISQITLNNLAQEMSKIV